MTSKEWLELAQKMSTPEGCRMAAAAVACNLDCPMEWPARRMLLAVALGMSETQVEDSFKEMVELGLITERFLH